MRGKTRNFIESVGLLSILASVIYGGYYLFFEKSPEKEIKKVVPVVIKEPLKIQKTIVQIKEPVKIQKTIVQIKKPLKIEKKSEPLIAAKNNNTIDKNEQNRLINYFLTNTKNKINTNIKQFLNTQDQNRSRYVNIRVTILKDGNFEHLKYMGGDKQYFDSIEPIIKTIFPIDMEEKIDDQFPRYFRMKIN